MTYFETPEDRSVLLEMISFDTGTALISFLCSEPQLSSIRSKLCGFTKFSPVKSDFSGNFEGFCLGQVQVWGNGRPFQVKAPSSQSFRSCRHASLGGGCSFPFPGVMWSLQRVLLLPLEFPVTKARPKIMRASLHSLHLTFLSLSWESTLMQMHTVIKVRYDFINSFLREDSRQQNTVTMKTVITQVYVVLCSAILHTFRAEWYLNIIWENNLLSHRR